MTTELLSIIPVLPSADLERDIAWYKEKLGFEINFSDYWVENFYEVPKKNITDNFYDVSLLWLDDFFKNGFPDYNAHNIVNYDDLKLRNYIFENRLKIWIYRNLGLAFRTLGIAFGI